MARAALKDDHVDSEAPINRDYGAEYYASHCGSVPYERNDHWLAFFGGIADRIVSSFSPVRAYDAGCALGFLTEALWDRGVECWGRDISTYAISQVRIDMRPFCDVGSIAEPPPGPGQFDLVTCIEVVEHMPEAEALAALDVLTAAAPRLLFSSRRRTLSNLPTSTCVQSSIGCASSLNAASVLSGHTTPCTWRRTPSSQFVPSRFQAMLNSSFLPSGYASAVH
jgi:hypothetical protein